jgi:hypothetical protein
MDNTAAIKTALESLLVQPDDACAFVIVEDAESEKFIQFMGSIERPLALDLPAQTLSESEFYRAVEFFRRRGVCGQEYDLLDTTGSRRVAEQFTFQKELQSVEKAIELVLEVFEKVYLRPGCELLVTEG